MASSEGITTPIIIGITGGICSGKSKAIQILSSNFDIIPIDADKLGHECYEPGTGCMMRIVEAFGEGIVEAGYINRRILGGIVFGDKSKMELLQSIVWPEIRKKIVTRIATLSQSGTKAIALEAAVMIEAKWEDLVTVLWVFQVDPTLAVARLMARNSLTLEDADMRVKAQLSNAERAAYASVIFENSSDLEKLERDIVSHGREIGLLPLT